MPLKLSVMRSNYHKCLIDRKIDDFFLWVQYVLAVIVVVIVTVAEGVVVMQ